MNTSKCPLCGGDMQRWGKNKNGTQRWRCPSCKATSTRKYDNDAKLLKQFLDWLLSKKTQRSMPGEGRTFRRKTAKFWDIWPLAPLVDEMHRVIYVDGIYLSKTAVIVIARGEEHVLGWHLARSENSAAYAALLLRIAPPEVVVSDGGPGFEKARRRIWKDTRVQRCTFHAFSQIKRYTTTRPKLEAGKELYGLAKILLRVSSIEDAELWVRLYREWCKRWENFLSEKTYTDDKGNWVWTHDRLVSARKSLNVLLSKNTLFTYLDPLLSQEGSLPAMNNKIEGAVNAPLRQLLREHRGMNIERRIKAVFWWCYLHTENPLSPAEILKTMPTGKDINELYRSVNEAQDEGGPKRWGTGIDWNDFRHSLPYKMDYD